MSCGMALPRFWIRRKRRLGAGPLQESICQGAELKQGVKWVCAIARRWPVNLACGKVGPRSGDMRLTAIWQNGEKKQLAVFVQVMKALKRLAFERMVPSCDGNPVWIVPEMGSLWWFPSIMSTTTFL